MAFTLLLSFFFFQAEDGIRDGTVTGVQTCALPIFSLVPGRVHPSAAVKAHDFLKLLTFHDYFTCALKAVAFSGKGINNVHLDCRISLKIRDSSRRADIGKDEMSVIPNGNCPLWRQIGCSIGANSSDEC